MNEDVVKRLVNWSYGKPSPPFKLEMWIPSGCNLKCKFCNRWRIKDIDGISDELIMSILKEAHSLGIKDFVISGFGEPFIRKPFLNILLKEVKNYEMNGCIVTNGTLLKKEDLEFLIDIKWNSVFFSLESCEASSHDSIVGMESAFGKLIQNVSNLSNIKEMTGSEYPIIHINVVLAKWNFKEVEDFIKLAKQSGVNKIDFQSLMSVKGNWGINKLESFKKEVSSAVDLAKEYNIETNLDSFTDIDYIKYSNEVEKILSKDLEGKEGFLSIPCYLPWWGMMITHNGKVGPCALLAERSKFDIYSSTLEDLWFNKFDFFRKQMSNNKVKGCMCCTPMVIENRRIREKLQNILEKN